MGQLAHSAPPGAADDWTIPQDWARYTAAEHALWDRLFARQAKQLQGRAVPAFLRGLDVLQLSKPGIPDFAELSARLGKLTGWRVVAAPGGAACASWLMRDESSADRPDSSNRAAHNRWSDGRFSPHP